MERMNRFFNTIESIENGSNKVISWSLSVVGGSLVVILSNNYIKPDCQLFKMAYILFGVGWFFIGFSIYNGRNITNSKIAAVLYDQNEENLKEILKNVNKYYKRQLTNFNLSLFAFGLWLILYLLWWIFG